MELRKVVLVIADISGYTSFIDFHKTSLLHAEEIITALLEAVLDKTSHPLVLNKLEGDAALLYARFEDADSQAAARDVLRQVQSFFSVFHAKALELSGSRADCPCEACQRIRDLRLKAILHQGEVAFKRLRQFEEMAGRDVIVAHRLLKNTITADEYILITDAFAELAGGLPGESRRESCEGLGAVDVTVLYPAERKTGPVRRIFDRLLRGRK